MNEQKKITPDARGQLIGTVEIKKIGNSSESSSRKMCLRG